MYELDIFPIVFLYAVFGMFVIVFYFIYKSEWRTVIALGWAIMIVTTTVGVIKLSKVVILVFVIPFAVWGFITWLYYSDLKRDKKK